MTTITEADVEQAGLAAEEIAESYPPVSTDAVKAALRYAAELARERIVPLGA